MSECIIITEPQGAFCHRHHCFLTQVDELCSVARMASEVERLTAELADRDATIQRVANELQGVTVALAQGCLCHGDVCSGKCGRGTPWAWNLDPERITAALAPKAGGETAQVAATAAMWAGSLLCSCGEVVIERDGPQYLGTSRHSKDGCTSSGPCTCGKVTDLASFGAGCDAIRIAGILHCSFAPCTTEGFPEMPEHG